MELIPILSTIILVATISTFILAIGAYILYKVRGAKGQQTYIPKPAEVRGELITPAAAPAPEVQYVPAYAEEPMSYAQRQPIFVNQVSAQPSQSGYNPQPQQFNAGRAYASASAGRSSGTKFLKYTSEGYVTPQEDNKKTGALKWR